MYWTNKRLEGLAQRVRMSFEDTKNRPKEIERKGKKTTVKYETAEILFDFGAGTYLYIGKDVVGGAPIPRQYK